MTSSTSVEMRGSERAQCLVCDSLTIDPMTEVDGYPIVRCGHCGFMFVHPRPAAVSLHHLYADVPDNPYLAETFEAFSHERPTLERIVSTIWPFVPGGSLFEVGCGRGDFLAVAAERGFDAQGCDLGTVNGSDRGSNVSIHQGALVDLKLAPGQFDVVVTRNTIEHLLDPARELIEIHRILKPHGLLYIKVPCSTYEHGLRCRLLFRKAHAFCPPFHLNHFNQANLGTLLRKTGIEPSRWDMELPTRHPNPLRREFERAGYLAIQSMKLVTGGRFFPKPILVCLARKSATT